MSQAQTAAVAAHVPDAYLLNQKAPTPSAKLEIETYKSGKSIRLVTPIGRFSYVHLDKPMPKVKDGAPVFSVNILCGPDSCADLWNAIVKLADAHWQVAGHTLVVGDDGVIKLRNPQTGVLLVSPIKSGDFFYQKDPKAYGIYKGLFFLNPTTAADKAPVYLDAREAPLAASAFYSGCYGRAFIEIATIAEKQGYAKGLTSYIRSVQFVRHGDKLEGYDVAGAAREAFASAPLPPEVVQAATQPAAGPGPGPVPAGIATPAGFAAPPSGARLGRLRAVCCLAS